MDGELLDLVDRVMRPVEQLHPIASSHGTIFHVVTEACLLTVAYLPVAGQELVRQAITRAVDNLKLYDDPSGFVDEALAGARALLSASQCESGPPLDSEAPGAAWPEMVLGEHDSGDSRDEGQA
jgi:hypothetical protein